MEVAFQLFLNKRCRLKSDTIESILFVRILMLDVYMVKCADKIFDFQVEEQRKNTEKHFLRLPNRD